NESEHGVYSEYRRKQLEDEKARHEASMKAEVRLLDQTSPEEFNRRRLAQGHLIVEPDLPLDEMSMGDFVKARLRSRRDDPRDLADMSVDDYIKARNQQTRGRRRR